MNKEIKEIFVNGTRFQFFFHEEINTWRILHAESLIDDFILEIEIDLAVLSKPIDWNEIADFFAFIMQNRQQVNENLKAVKVVLAAYFKALWRDAYSEDYYRHMVYEPTGIDYVGYHNDRFEYNIFYYPFHEIEEYKWMEPVVYRARFRNHSLIGIHSDIN